MPTFTPGRHSKALLGNSLQNRARRTRFSRLVVQGDIDRMLTYPGPTYVIGIDERPGHERAYIVSVNRPGMGRIQGLPPTFPLDAANMNALWEEVAGSWSGRNMVMHKS